MNKALTSQPLMSESWLGTRYIVKLIIASLRAHAGKTSIIAGLANILDQPFGYMKPFGDRSLYRKKRLWDQDAALMTNLFSLTDAPEERSITLVASCGMGKG